MLHVLFDEIIVIIPYLIIQMSNFNLFAIINVKMINTSCNNSGHSNIGFCNMQDTFLSEIFWDWNG